MSETKTPTTLQASQFPGKNQGCLWTVVVASGLLWAGLAWAGLSYSMSLKESLQLWFWTAVCFVVFAVFLWVLTSDRKSKAAFEIPQITLELPVRLGETVTAHYSQVVHGSLRLSKIKWTLRHQEVHQEGSGEDARTITNTHYEDEKIYDCETQCAPGQRFDFSDDFTIPATASPTTTRADGRRFFWFFQIDVEARGHPDFHAEFPLEISDILPRN